MGALWNLSVQSLINFLKNINNLGNKFKLQKRKNNYTIVNIAWTSVCVNFFPLDSNLGWTYVYDLKHIWEKNLTEELTHPIEIGERSDTAWIPFALFKERAKKKKCLYNISFQILSVANPQEILSALDPWNLNVCYKP